MTVHRPSARQNRDAVFEEDVATATGAARFCIAVAGIDHYSTTTRLHNAVNDAREVLDAFEQLGFQRIVAPLYDGHATRAALLDLVEDLRCKLRRDDSLVLFFAGHGRSVTTTIDGSLCARKGYLLPVDADAKNHSWVDLASWLPDVARLPARHILVILDSCYSGVALDRDIQFRGIGVAPPGEGVPPRMRRSRRVLTSARDNEKASDSGPVRGHSLFAGCLLRGLRGGLLKRLREPRATYLALAAYVQDEVRGHAREEQNPDFGTLEGDDRGELFLPLSKSAGKQRAKPRVQALPQRGAEAARGAVDQVPLDRSEGWRLDPAFAAALDRHAMARAEGFHVLSLIAGDPMATQTMWATWAARYGYLTLRTEARDVSTAIAELLHQLPWLRCLAEARKRLATAARIAVESVDAALDARSPGDRRRWIDNVADRHAKVSGWLLSTLRESAAALPDLASAPAQGGDLLAIACDLACPTAVLIQCAHGDAAWLETALGVAAALVTYVPKRCVAVVAPADVANMVLGHVRGTAITMAQQGLLRLTALAERIPGRGRRHTLEALNKALASDPRTRGRFEMDRPVVLDGTAMDVGLLAARARVVIEIDGWHHVHDPEGYERDRIQDLRLQRAGHFVMRFLAEDVDDRLPSTIDEIALALASRRTQGGMS